MTGKNAFSGAQPTYLDPLETTPFVEPTQHEAIVYSWKAASANLSSAVLRANSFSYRFGKRAFDIFVSAFLLILFLPLGLAIALAIKISSPGPIFYCEERVGRFRVPFRIFKFRSMYVSRSSLKILDISTAQFISSDSDREKKHGRNPRITPLGRLLRKLSLDELPQVWNVMRGDMSLVGPRPIIESERRLYGQYLPFYDLFSPGLTGLWQVSGRSDVDYATRVQLDTQYASRWSYLGDLAILARTIPAVITTRGAY